MTDLDSLLVKFNQTADINQMHNVVNQIAKVITQDNVKSVINFFIRCLITGERNRVQVACCAFVYYVKQNNFVTTEMIKKQALEILTPISNEYARVQRTIAALGVCHILEALSVHSNQFAIEFSKQFVLSLQCELLLYQAYKQFNYDEADCALIFQSPAMKYLQKPFALGEESMYAKLLMEAAMTEEHPFVKRFVQDYQTYDCLFLSKMLQVASQDKNYSYLTVTFTKLLKDTNLSSKNSQLLKFIIPFEYLKSTVSNLLTQASKDDMKYLAELITTVQQSDCEDYKNELVIFVSKQEKILCNKIIYQFSGFVSKKNINEVMKNACLTCSTFQQPIQIITAITFMANISKKYLQEAVTLYLSVFCQLVGVINTEILYEINIREQINTLELKNQVFKVLYQAFYQQQQIITIISRVLMDAFQKNSDLQYEKVQLYFPILFLAHQFLNQKELTNCSQYNEIFKLSKDTFEHLVVLSLFQDQQWIYCLKQYNQLVLILDSQNVTELTEEQQQAYFDQIGFQVVNFIIAFVNMHSKTLSQFSIQVFKCFLPIFDTQLIQELINYISIDYLIQNLLEDENIEESFEPEEENLEEHQNTFAVKNMSENEYDQMIASAFLSKREQNKQKINIYHQVSKSLDLLKTFLDEQPDSPGVFPVLFAIFQFLQFPTGLNHQLQNFDRDYQNQTIQKAKQILTSACKNKQVRELVPIEQELVDDKFGLENEIQIFDAIIREKLPLHDLALLFIKLICYALAGILESSQYYQKAEQYLTQQFLTLSDYLIQPKFVYFKDFFVDFFSVRFEAFFNKFVNILIAKIQQLDQLKPGIICLGVFHELFVIRSKEITNDNKIVITKHLIQYGMKELQRQFEKSQNGDEDVQLKLLEQYSEDMCKFIISLAKRQNVKLVDTSVEIIALCETLKASGIQIGKQQIILAIWKKIGKILE